MSPPTELAACTAQICEFAAAELRWKPAAGAEAPVAVKLQIGGAGGDRNLLLGDKCVKLADIRGVTPLTPGFVALQAKELGHIGLKCKDEASLRAFVKELVKRKADYERFEQYDQGSVQSYFQYYAKLGNQQNMLQDATRTSTYRDAIVTNTSDFGGATVMDVGAGSGILSFFSCQAGASVVYAVEASSAAHTVQALADANKANLGGAEVKVINKPLETIGEEDIAEKVDVLVSEPIGTFLFNERMIETYLCARDRFLKPGGKMFPNVGNLCLAPFSDATLHGEQQAKNAFWQNTDFYGLDLTAAAQRSTCEHFMQPIVDYINPDFLVSDFVTTRFDFMTATVESLHDIEIPFCFAINYPCLVHGLAGWFDAIFEGSDTTVTLSTAPWCPGTHWYQIRFLLETPLAVNGGQFIEGKLRMEANNLQSYYISINMGIKGTSIVSTAERIDLKDPEYRFFTSANTYVPPGTASAFAPQAAAGEAVQPAAAPAAAAATGSVFAWDASAAPSPPVGAPQKERPAQPSCRYTARSRSASRRVQ